MKRKRKYYTGVGSRTAPTSFLKFASATAKALEEQGYTLRSGGANGSDDAFESGLYSPKAAEIYLPWAGFNDRYHGGCFDPSFLDEYWSEAAKIAAKHHPIWSSLKDSVKNLHTRNVFQVLGQDLDTPSDFVLLYASPVGSDSVKGGTNMAYQVAREYGVPIINFYEVFR